MEEKKRIRTDNDRKADKKYNEKSITFGLGYRNKDELIEGRRLKYYLDNNGMSANAYLKQLVKIDLDNKGIDYPNDME